MLFTLVLFSLVLVSIIGIILLIIYKMMRIGRDTETVTSGGTSPDALKKKLTHFFEGACKKSAHFVFPKVKNIFHVVKRRISDKHVAFTDRMNGKGDTSKKGAASFFLKNVAEHKRTLHEKK